MERRIEQTQDGSYTLYVPSMDEHYHSVKGALTESLHIFVQTGLKAHPAASPRVLEIGFGTGLNAFLTWMEADASRRVVRYTTLERYPVDEALWRAMAYPQHVAPERADDFARLHRCGWDSEVALDPWFRFCKRQADVTAYPFPPSAYDVVYWDAFAPEKQPEMWTRPLMEQMYATLDEGGLLVTYCAKGAVRRLLQDVGFEVERLPGPPGGKREILRATKRTKRA